jgi:hypothetical protein
MEQACCSAVLVGGLLLLVLLLLGHCLHCAAPATGSFSSSSAAAAAAVPCAVSDEALLSNTASCSIQMRLVGMPLGSSAVCRATGGLTPATLLQCRDLPATK